jgi:hypothetical protein
MGLLMRPSIAALLLCACVPDLATDLSRVDAPRVLAVSATPAEAAPGEPVTLTALYADASGTLAEAPLAWSLCTARRPLAELGPVSRACLDAGSESLLTLGTGLSVQATLPADACRLFGPEPPPASDGQPSGRPVDPDPSGGYYQPILAAAPEPTLFQVRLGCGLAGATQQQSAEFRRRYQANAAPAIATLAADGVVLPTDAPLVASAGQAVVLRVSWATCPEEPTCGDGLCTLDEAADTCPGDCTGAPGCGGAETYLRFDPAALALARQREALRVAWYATAGTFDLTSTGRAASERDATSDNTWTAPDEPGPATIWVVLRDDRGGASWRALTIDVQ